MELVEEKIRTLKSQQGVRHVPRDTLGKDLSRDRKRSLPIVIYEQCIKQKMVYILIMGSKS